LQLKQIKSGEFLFLSKLQKHFGTCIRVVTANALEDFAIEAKQAANQFRAAFKAEEERITESSTVTRVAQIRDRSWRSREGIRRILEAICGLKNGPHQFPAVVFRCKTKYIINFL
jgi:hypothetical protein